MLSAQWSLSTNFSLSFINLFIVITLFSELNLQIFQVILFSRSSTESLLTSSIKVLRFYFYYSYFSLIIIISVTVIKSISNSPGVISRLLFIHEYINACRRTLINKLKMFAHNYGRR